MPSLSTSSVNIDPIEDRLHYDRRPCRWRLQTCCFFVSLRSGCYGISILSMVEALLYMSLASSVLFLHNTTKCNNTDDVQCKLKIMKGELDHENLLSNYVRHAITSKSTTDGRASQRTLQSNLDSDAESTYLPSVVGAVVLVLLIMCVYFLVSALLFYGIMKRRPKLLSPWLWWSIGEMLATFHSFSLVERSVSLLLKVYCCFIVCSYIEKLKEQQREEEIVTYVSVRNGRSGGVGGVAALGGGPHYSGPGCPDIGGSPGLNPYVPTHVFIPTATSQDEFLVKMEGFNASRMYAGQRPPPYSPPLAGFVATTSSGASASGTAAAEEGAVGGTADVVTTAPTSIMAGATDPVLAVVTDAAAVAAVSGINSNNSMLPLLPPSYEEAVSDVAAGGASGYTHAPQIFTPSLSPLPDEGRELPLTGGARCAVVIPIPDSVPPQQQQQEQHQQSSQASAIVCEGTSATKPIENAAAE